MTYETLMSKIVKIFHTQTDKPTPRSSSPELKNKLDVRAEYCLRQIRYSEKKTKKVKNWKERKVHVDHNQFTIKDLWERKSRELRNDQLKDE